MRLAGRPILAYALEAVAASSSVDAIVVVAPGGHLSEAGSLATGAAAGKLLGVVAGGPTRQDSARLGLAAIPSTTTVVVVHDAARPFATPALYGRVIGAVRGPQGPNATRVAGAIPVVPSPDTIKRVRDGSVIETVPRSGLVLAQTPQGFEPSVLRAAHDAAQGSGLVATDDAMLVEAAGGRVLIHPSPAENFKVTTPLDLRLAEQLLRQD